MNAQTAARLLRRKDSGVTVTEPGRGWMESESGRGNTLPPVVHTPYGVLYPDRAPDDETAPAGAQSRRVRAVLAAVLKSGTPWGPPKAGHTIADASGTYTIDAVTVYRENGAATAYEVRAVA